MAADAGGVWRRDRLDILIKSDELGLDPSFLLQFAQRGVRGGLAQLDMAAGKGE